MNHKWTEKEGIVVTHSRVLDIGKSILCKSPHLWKQHSINISNNELDARNENKLKRSKIS